MAAPGPVPASTASTVPSVDKCSSIENNVIVRQAVSREDLASIAALFDVYTKSLGIDLSFQSYAAELSSLPGAYASPTGSLLLATDTAGIVLGCFAVRSLPYGSPGDSVCEAKRLYVTPEGRGKGVASALVRAGITNARRAGYTQMNLDSLSDQHAAHKLYKRYGFVEIEPYYQNPHVGTLYMSLDLSKD